MRTSILISSFAAVLAAQSIDFAAISAAPAVTVTAAPVTGTAESLSVQPSNAASSIGSAAVQATPLAQRAIEKRDGDCSKQPAGTGPAVHNPNTPEAFSKNSYFKAAAYSAKIPFGYEPSFINLNASTSTSSYMGYTALNAYDTNQCATLCNKQIGCMAFNLYFERDPTLDPNAQSCSNPPSLTNIKCVFWGVPLSKATATNDGQYRDYFQVVIAGSNGYNLIQSPPSLSGWGYPTPFPGAPKCPSDPTGGYSTFIGAKFFSFGILASQVQYFTTSVCFSACSSQTSYNLAHPPSTGKPKVCNFVVANMLTDSKGVAQGMYCTMYTESGDAQYGTVSQSAYTGGEWSWDSGYAFAYTNASYSASYKPICQGKSCKIQYAGGNCGGWGAGTC